MKSNATASTTSIATTPNEISVPAIGASGLRKSRDRLELLVDRLQLDQLAHVVFLAEQARHRRAHDPVGVGLEAIDLLAGLERGRGDPGLADLGQQRHRMLDALATLRAQVAEA